MLLNVLRRSAAGCVLWPMSDRATL